VLGRTPERILMPFSASMIALILITRALIGSFIAARKTVD
jgi:hypothetical protein